MRKFKLDSQEVSEVVPDERRHLQAEGLHSGPDIQLKGNATQQPADFISVALKPSP
jgi:hypothetical protein